jgi:hypothetical protein
MCPVVVLKKFFLDRESLCQCGQRQIKGLPVGPGFGERRRIDHEQPEIEIGVGDIYGLPGEINLRLYGIDAVCGELQLAVEGARKRLLGKGDLPKDLLPGRSRPGRVSLPKRLFAGQLRRQSMSSGR